MANSIRLEFFESIEIDIEQSRPSQDDDLPTEVRVFIEQVGEGFHQVIKFFHMSRSAVPESDYVDPTADLEDKDASSLNDIFHFKLSDARKLGEVARLEATHSSWNDRDYDLENVIKVCTCYDPKCYHLNVLKHTRLALGILSNP